MISTLSHTTSDPYVPFSSIDSAIEYSRSMDVRETNGFETNELVYQGGAIASPYGTFALTEFSNKDLLERGGIAGSSENFANNEVLTQALGSACNKYLLEGPDRNKAVKVVHRAAFPGEDTRGHDRVALGVPSARYSLVRHEVALQKISRDLPIERLLIGPAEMDLIVSQPNCDTVDRLGEIVKVGLNLKNSVGNRWCALTMSVATFRLVCLNGCVAPVGSYGMTMRHSGGLLLNGNFQDKVNNLSNKAITLAKALPLLTKESIKEYIPVLSRTLPCAVGSKPATAYLEEVREKRPQAPLGDIWNDITTWPKKLERQDQKNKCEEVGFRLLMEAIKRRN